MHDFTDERNWRCLADIKVGLKDNDGLGIVLEDVFTVLGRDTEQFEKLKQLDYLELGLELLRLPCSRSTHTRCLVGSPVARGGGDEQSDEVLLEIANLQIVVAIWISVTSVRTLSMVVELSIFVCKGLRICHKLSRHLLAHRPVNHEFGCNWAVCMNGDRRLILLGRATITFRH